MAERRRIAGGRNLELTDRRQGIERRAELALSPGVGEGRLQRLAGEVHVAELAIAGLADPLGILADADDDRSGIIASHYSTCPSSMVIVAPVTWREASEHRNTSGASSASIGHIRRRWNAAIWRCPPSVWNQSPAISVWI